ncbi:hypothetical protein PHYBLDRAFT_61756 [Phycomyces blakesleeanus NRRL 1555(-)]|uniref:PAS domain-containing protein n=1 Tax=Phycomyces blakesleeanus (strain ATCC 8743b / DSM 1359 / FGSC 10004 / NBRC 33097 / NRRL 1555) TaxID=763407 RepID=A0A162V7W7_PHYB8|nr:hypothetical protein PHYBLDRAFT_61756 [Phycomyces blakesleeanus NRRL 1555(-)]OAD80703.1 hypothetical protein PHYBLDRAFT_61756 [Phycomyces blakesleeanus NRRL 1555(-)]|eukprot:XP_018298743.1 hypothetical protein PHYBLDRAFT_61756 [Phycomyces blakesleeanus NRRL 1555(-)]
MFGMRFGLGDQQSVQGMINRPTITIILSLDFQITSVSDEVMVLWGFEPKAFVGRCLSDLVAEDHGRLSHLQHCLTDRTDLHTRTFSDQLVCFDKQWDVVMRRELDMIESKWRQSALQCSSRRVSSPALVLPLSVRPLILHASSCHSGLSPATLSSRPLAANGILSGSNAGRPPPLESLLPDKPRLFYPARDLIRNTQK